MAKNPDQLTDAELDTELAQATTDDDPATGYGNERQRALRAEKTRRATNPRRTEPKDWTVPDKQPEDLTDTELADALTSADRRGRDQVASRLRREQRRRQQDQDEEVSAAELIEADRMRERGRSRPL
jgi:hypothetical protein